MMNSIILTTMVTLFFPVAIMAFEIEDVDRGFLGGAIESSDPLKPGTKFSTLFGERTISKILIGHRFFSRSRPTEKAFRYAVKNVAAIDPKKPFSCSPFGSARIVFTDGSIMDIGLLNGGTTIGFGSQIFALDILNLPPNWKEQYGAGQPATAPESKPEGNQNTKPESEGHSQ